MKSLPNVKQDAWMKEMLGKESYVLNINDEFIRGVNEVSSPEYKWMEEIKSNRIFIFCKIATDKIEHVEFAESAGFRLVDTNVTLLKNKVVRRELEGPAEITYCFAEPEDREQTTEVAGRSFIYSRFHLDKKISKAIADSIKAQWVENYFYGKRGDKMVLAKLNGRVVGFHQILLKEDTLTIDLIAVAPEQRKKGIAQNLIQFAENNIRGVKKVLVGTQISNIPSVRLYEKMGFFFHDAKYVFHFHN